MKKHITPLFIFFLLILFKQGHCQWTTICNSGNGFVDNFENFNGELYATGFFKTICGTPCNYVAKYNGSTWQAVGNGFPHAGHHLAAINGTLYGVAYQPNLDSNWLYKFDGTSFNKMGEGTFLTTAVTGFSQTNNLYNIIDYNGAIVVSGEFDRVGSKRISGIMQWNGTEWDSLASGLSGNIAGTAPVMYPHSMCISGTDLIVGGNFKNAGKQLSNGIARWDGTQWHPLGQGFNGTVYGVCEYKGQLYAGGEFTMSGTTQLNRIARWNGVSWIDPGFGLFYGNPSNYSFIHTLKVLNNKLMISGGFDKALVGTDTLRCYGIVAYDGTAVDTLGGGITGNEAEAIAIYNGLLYVGGGPTNSNTYVAAYNLPSSVKEIAASPYAVSVFPNPSSSEVNVTCERKIDQITVSNLLGQTLFTITPQQNQTSFHIGNAGIYIVTVSSGKQLVVKKLSIAY